MRTLNLLLLATTLATGCLADDSTTDPASPGLQPGKGIHSPRLDDALLDQILTTPAGAIEVPPAGTASRAEATWIETTAIPEACSDCTVTVRHTITADLITLEVLADTGATVCGITARRLDGGFDILADSCLARAE